MLDWRELADDYRQRTLPPYRLFPGVNCGWDNEPRRPGKGAYLPARVARRATRDWLARHHRPSPVAGTCRPDRSSSSMPGTSGPKARCSNPMPAWAMHGCMQRVAPSNGHRGAMPSARDLPWPLFTRGIRRHSTKSSTPCRHPGSPFRIVVTTTPEQATAIRAILERRQVEAELVVGENRGRDILPFLRVAYRLRAEGRRHCAEAPYQTFAAP